MTNVVNLADVRARKEEIRLQKEEEANKASLKQLILDIGEDAYRPSAEDKYFELRMRDAVLDWLSSEGRINQQHLGGKTSTQSFIITVSSDGVEVASPDFFSIAERIAKEIKGPIGYLHSVMISRPSYEWSVMLRFYTA